VPFQTAGPGYQVQTFLQQPIRVLFVPKGAIDRAITAYVIQGDLSIYFR